MRSEFAYIQGWHQKLASMGWWHSFELPDGTVIEGVCPLDGLRNRLAQFPIPQDLRGKRVLDIGAWDGFFTFELEKRGAEVLAIDCWDNPRFRLMGRCSDRERTTASMMSTISHRQMSAGSTSLSSLGCFTT